MGRRPCCAKEGLNRGSWSAREDKILTNYIKVHGEGKWRDLPQRAGLKRCGKSCRLRWLNYLRPDIKRGNISMEEEELIIRLHKLLGNRWSLIAGRLPGRTDNEIKNYWNSNLSKRVDGHKNKGMRKSPSSNELKPSEPNHEVIRTKAVRCTKVNIIPRLLNNHMVDQNNLVSPNWEMDENSTDFLLDFDINDLLVLDALNTDLHQSGEINECDDHINVVGEDCGHNDISSHPEFLLSDHNEFPKLDHLFDATMLENWKDTDPLNSNNEDLGLKNLASFLNSEDEWIN